MSAKPTLVQLIINATTAGKAMLTAANAAAQKTLLSLVKGDVGLGNVDNTSDANKPVSTAQQTALDAKQATLVSGANIKTVNSSSLLGSGDLAISGLSGTGSVDNAALRADGTGGATLQNSAWIINDNLTASPNNTVNHACLEATGGTTNVSVSIKPKGSGAFSLSAPDGTSTGGNARGTNAVDLQTARSAAAQVASGTAAIAMNQLCTASGRGAIAGGYQSVASGQFEPIALGKFATASGTEGSVAIGPENVASASYTNAFGYGSTATRHGQASYSAGYFAAAGDAQKVSFVCRNKTTNSTPTTLFLDGSATRLTITSGKVLSFTARITGIKSDGSAVAEFLRRGVIKNVGGTTSLAGSIETIGTDIEDNASTDIAITADNTNDALQINVTGLTAETWRWVAVVEGLEIAYGN